VIRYRPPRLLDAADRIEEFACRSSEQTDWLRRHARQSAASSSTRVFVVTSHDDRVVVAYYAWCMAQIDLEAAPPRLRKGAGRYPQPVALLARLGVDAEHEGRGLGAGLLADAIARLVGISEDIGCRGLLIHAETDEARQFYLHLVPELMPSPTDDLHLVLLMKDVRHTLLTSAEPRGPDTTSSP
jgi:GNAT superfamily N-acetyltransferase